MKKKLRRSISLETTKKQRLKEIRLRPNIAKHDLDTKTRQIIKFLTQGNKVRIGIFFKGRENEHTQPGVDIINTIMEATTDVGKPDSKPSLKGSAMSIVFSPISNKGKKHNNFLKL